MATLLRGLPSGRLDRHGEVVFNTGMTGFRR